MSKMCASLSAICLLALTVTVRAEDNPSGFVLKSESYRHFIEGFNKGDDELYKGLYPNSKAWDFLKDNIPLLDCPDKDILSTYYFRWWSYRKHIKQTPVGLIVDEFLPPVEWAGPYNSINCPAGHHIYEGRWMKDPKVMDDYSKFWFRSGGGSPRQYSFWAADSIWARYCVTGDKAFTVGMLPELIANYEGWEKSHRDANGLYWQNDGSDGMEVSIGGSGYRATINSYQYGDANAISQIAELAGKPDVAAKFRLKAATLKDLVQTKLWDKDAQFFKVKPQGENKPLANVRELHGLTPWYFNLPDPQYSVAWKQVMDPKGFYAPFGLTTAEQRHPQFALEYANHECQWNGPSWPLATSITLTGLANLLNGPAQDAIGRSDYFKLLRDYTKAHQITLEDGRVVPWIDENLNPYTGDWISRTRLKTWKNGTWDAGKGGVERGKDYNHSTYCDLVISGLIGLRPRADNVVEVNPLVPADWASFCLDQVPYHGRMLTILWDKTGKKYGKGKGLRVFADGRLLVSSPKLGRVFGRLTIGKQYTPEPADPDQLDLSVWDKVKPGIHSGFGSIDSAESKSIPPEVTPTAQMSLNGWKGERVNSKLLVWSAVPIKDVSITASKLVSGSHEIGVKNTTISVIRYVLTDEFPGGIDRREKGKIPAHLKPDLLTKNNSFDLEPRETRPVWISVNIPSDASPGTYRGDISVQTLSGTVRHPITLEVQNRRLPAPAKWSFHLDLWQNPFAVARYHRVALWSPEHIRHLRSLLIMLAQAGQKCITATIIDKPWGDQVFDSHGSMILWTRKSDEKWEFDYTAFDQYVELAMECGITEQINCYSMVPVGNMLTWFDEPTRKLVSKELTPGTPEYKRIWRIFLTDFKAHLKSRGWLHKTTIALDEREEDEMAKLFQFLKTAAPELKVAMAGFYYKGLNPSIYDFSSNWHAVKDIAGDVVRSRKARGLKTTYYVACMIPKPNNFTFSPPSESCYEGWYASAMGFDGFLRWAYNSWVESPETDSRYVTWPSGDAFLVYPDAQSSVRFERIREGIQDFEKLRIIRAELARSDSPKAAVGRAKVDGFLAGIGPNTLTTRSAADVINEGKRLLYEVVKSLSEK
jgi:hypothetical protein